MPHGVPMQPVLSGSREESQRFLAWWLSLPHAVEGVTAAASGGQVG